MADHTDLRADSPVQWTKALLQQPPGPFPPQWEGFDSVRQAFAELLHEQSHNVPAPPVWEADRGIVICAGGWRFFPSLYVTIRVIRHTGCQLPIQVWYLGDMGEFDPRMAAALAPYDVGWICGNSYAREHGIQRRLLGGWQLKPFAACYAPYREVIFLDADSYPAYNPEEFLAHPEYARVGAAFWPDQHPLEPGQWERFGLEHHKEQAWESGQFIVDKGRHWRPLWLTNWMNDYSDYVYKHIYGDKDTFHICWRVCGHEVCLPTQHPGWDRVAFLQKDFSGNTLFCHRTRDKFRWAHGEIDGQPVTNWYMTGQWHGETQVIPSLPHEHFAHHCLKESDQLIRPERFFEFVGGPRGWCRDVWDSVALYNEYRLPQTFGKDDVILDCGANVGAFAAACLRRGASHVFCVEPYLENQEKLTHNLNAIAQGRHTLMPFALWPDASPVPLHFDAAHVAGNTATLTAMKPAGALAGEFPTRTLDDTLRDAARSAASGRIRLVKLDIEGAEYPAMFSAQSLHLADEIIGEGHANIEWGGMVFNAPELVELLAAQGFDATVTPGHDGTYLFRALPRANP